MIDPFSMAIGAVLGCAVLGLPLGLAIGLPIQRKKRGTPASTLVGEAVIEVTYTCLPDAFFGQLERDLALLNPDDRVDVCVEISAPWGWTSMVSEPHWLHGERSQREISLLGDDSAFSLSGVHARADGLADVLRQLLMDKDSRLVKALEGTPKGHAERFPELVRRQEGGWAPVQWQDDDSPLTFKVSGRVYAQAPLSAAEPAAVSAEPEECSQRKAAEEEVENLRRHHLARISNTGREV